MQDTQRLMRRGEGRARQSIAGQLISGLLVLYWLVFQMVTVAAGTERAVIYYSPG